MKHFGKKLTALLLAACMLLAPAACGGGEDEKKEQLSANVFVPTYTALDLDVEYVDRTCFSGDYIFVVGETYQEEEVTETDPVTGEEYTYMNTTPVYNLYRAGLDGSNVETLANYVPSGTAGENSWFYINDLTAGEDGTIYVTEYSETTTFDLPENFDPETDDRWNYADTQSVSVLRHLDAEGSELDRTEGEANDQNALAEQLGAEWLNGVYHDTKGNTYAVGDSFIAVLDSANNELFRVEGENMYNSMVELADGSMSILVYHYDEQAETSSQTLKTIDLEAKDWGAEYPMPASAYEVYRGGGDYLFYYRNSDSIYGWKKGADAGERLFAWIDADVNSGNVQSFTFRDDGRVLALTSEWMEDGHPDIELVTLTPTPRSELPEKTTLTYGTMYLDYEMRGRIIDFNKTSTTHRIEVRDYSEYETGDGTGALTRLNTEMIAGNVPDILDVEGMPIRQYGAKGMLEDLWTWIDNDPEISRDGLILAPFNAASQDGKLYYIFSDFAVRTAVGATDVVGDRTSWTVADLQAALATMPEGCTVFAKYNTRDGVLTNVLAQNLDSFINWDTGECSFDTPAFKSLLEFCNSFPAEYNYDEEDDMVYESDYARMMKGQQLLYTSSMSSLDWYIQELEAVFDGNYSYVGYPKEDGSVGSSFVIYEGLAMSSSCKDKEAAWDFMREDLLPRADENGYHYYLPANKADFDKSAENAMREYEVDENGEVMVDENGDPIPVYSGSVWIDDSTEIETKPLTQAGLDKFMDLVNSITSVYSSDESVFNIIREETGAYFAGDKTLDNTANLIQSKVTLYVNEQK